jgi:hypothetical protein
MDLERVLSLVGGVSPAASWEEFVADVLDAVDGFSPARRRAFFLTVLGLLHGSLDEDDVVWALGARPLESDVDVTRYARRLARRTRDRDA